MVPLLGALFVSQQPACLQHRVISIRPYKPWLTAAEPHTEKRCCGGDLIRLAQCCPAANPLTNRPGSAALAAASKEPKSYHRQVYLLMRQHKPQTQLLALGALECGFMDTAASLYACEQL